MTNLNKAKSFSQGEWRTIYLFNKLVTSFEEDGFVLKSKHVDYNYVLANLEKDGKRFALVGDPSTRFLVLRSKGKIVKSYTQELRGQK